MTSKLIGLSKQLLNPNYVRQMTTQIKNDLSKPPVTTKEKIEKVYSAGCLTILGCAFAYNTNYYYNDRNKFNYRGNHNIFMDMSVSLFVGSVVTMLMVPFVITWPVSVPYVLGKQYIENSK